MKPIDSNYLEKFSRPKSVVKKASPKTTASNSAPSLSEFVESVRSKSNTTPAFDMSTEPTYPTTSDEREPDATVVADHTQTDLSLSPYIDDIIFNEKNLEAWAHLLFPHAKTKGLTKTRTVNIGSSQIAITPLAGSKAYTHRTYMTLLAVFLMWYRNPNPDGEVEGHLNDIVRIKKQSTKSPKNRDSVYEDLDCLSGTATDWIRSFDINGKPMSLERVHLLCSFEYQKGVSEKDGSSFNRKFKCKIYPEILARLKEKKINPIAYESLLNINRDMAGIYFRYIDSKIALKSDGKPWEWNSFIFFKELGFMENPRYKEKAYRKIAVTKIAKEINGKHLSSGATLRASVHETADKKDIKIRHFVEQPTFTFNNKKSYPIVNKDADLVSYLADEIADVVGQKDTAMKWYRKIAQHYDQTLIFRALGLFKEAKETNRTPIETEGGLFSYFVHRLAHEMGYDWIGECTATCELRPENQLTTKQ